MTAKTVAVVGAGMSGSAAAWRLHRAGLKVTLLDSRPEVGGVAQSFERDGYRFERGPNTIQGTSKNFMELVAELGMTGALMSSRAAAHRRLIWRHGKVHVLPEGPGAFFKSELIGWRGKLRALAEPFVRPQRTPSDETLGQFFERRLGSEIVRGFLDPFVAGVFAGSPEALGIDAFPALARMETEHGGLVRAMIARARSKTAGPRPGKAGLLAFDDGLQSVPLAVAQALAKGVKTDTEVLAVTPDADGAKLKSRRRGKVSTRRYDHVVLAASAYATAQLLRPLDARVAVHLEEPKLPHPFFASVALGYDRSAVAHDLNAFGVLCASDSPIPSCGPVLGVLFPSSVFDGRAPAGKVSLQVMLGGARDPRASELDEKGLISRAQNALRALVGAQGTPDFIEVTRLERGIPQYAPGHIRRIAKVRQAVAEMGSITLAGNYLDGVSVEGCVGSGFAAATSVIAGLA